MNTRRSTKFLSDYTWFIRHCPRMAVKIDELITDIRQHPISGLGKPKALRNSGEKVWSWRIDKKHRLVYHVEGDEITLLQCRNHYDDH
ncbi:MAG: Txe/YoeB family addiction module toxin [Puniceicoccales bacterium]|nr:Txe/YoeB family addiction module toxin [Puniceicoccales bacterium]